MCITGICNVIKTGNGEWEIMWNVIERPYVPPGMQKIGKVHCKVT